MDVSAQPDLHLLRASIERDRRQQGREQDRAQIARPHIHQETRPGSGIFVTQCCKNPTRRPYDETGPHGFRVAEHRLGGNEDPRADDGAHDNADAADQAHLGCGGSRELVLHQIQLTWPAQPLPASLGCGQHSPKEALSQALSPVLLQESHQGLCSTKSINPHNSLMSQEYCIIPILQKRKWRHRKADLVQVPYTSTALAALMLKADLANDPQRERL